MVYVGNYRVKKVAASFDENGFNGTLDLIYLDEQLSKEEISFATNEDGKMYLQVNYPELLVNFLPGQRVKISIEFSELTDTRN